MPGYDGTSFENRNCLVEVPFDGYLAIGKPDLMKKKASNPGCEFGSCVSAI
jgi:hypothetical protein